MVTQAKRLKTEHEGATVGSLSWDHPVHLMGEKVNDPDLLNCCMLCCLPILVYGRLIPCKHVLCLDCARKHSSTICAKCGEKVTRVEQCQLGTVFVCSFGSSRHGVGGCRRTYLSYRDMEAHIKHRHQKKDVAAPQSLPAITQPAIHMSNPPPQFIRPPTMIPPPRHLVNHPPPSIAITTSVPPPGMNAHQQHGHQLQSSAVTMQGNITMAGPPCAIQGNAVVIQNASGIPSNNIRHPMPGHVMPPHQQRAPIHPPRHMRPQSGAIRQHNPPPTVSKSHGNLISIPLQGASNDSNYNTWGSGGQQQVQQQWQNNNRGSHHIPRQGHYNS